MLFSLLLPFLDVLIQTWTHVSLRNMQKNGKVAAGGGEVEGRRLQRRRRRDSHMIAVGSQVVAVKPLRSDANTEHRRLACSGGDA
jgi:hypothetical protein